MNAILNKNESNLKNCIIYVSLFPCNECAKLIIQSGIKKVMYLSDKYSHTEHTKASKVLFKLSGVTLEQFIPKRKSITIDFGCLNTLVGTNN